MMKMLILLGFFTLLVGCANSHIVDFMGDEYYFNVKYIDDSRFDIRDGEKKNSEKQIFEPFH